MELAIILQITRMTTVLQIWVSNLIQLPINHIQGSKNNQHIVWPFLHPINIDSISFCLKLYASSLSINTPPQICFSSILVEFNKKKNWYKISNFPKDLCLQLMESDFFFLGPRYMSLKIKSECVDFSLSCASIFFLIGSMRPLEV